MRWLFVTFTLGLLAAGCGDEESFAVLVDLQTDLVAGIEFDNVRVELSEGVLGETGRATVTTELEADPAAPFGAGVRVAEFDDVAPGRYVVRLQAIRGAGIVAERSVEIEIVDQSFAVRILLTRSCRGVSCPRAGDSATARSCVGGVCAEPACVTGREPACPPRECTIATDCAGPGVPCANADCVDGSCFFRVEGGVCSASQVCHPELGCVETQGPRDGGVDTCVPLPEICDGADDDCDGTADEDFDLATDRDNCGSCGNGCNATGGTSTCSGGVCAITCDATNADCDGDPTNGCETSLAAPESCGSCGNQCVDPLPLCQSNSSGSSCTDMCAAANVLCGTTCSDTSTDPTNCGSCGNACPGRPNTRTTCTAGSCGSTCVSGYLDCDGTLANGCEIDPSSNPSHCGSCGNACPSMGAIPLCTAGTCATGPCMPGFGNCDGNSANGCETMVNTLTDCGGCGVACAPPNASSLSCGSGMCTFSGCRGSWRDCDGDPANGCEADTDIDRNNCGRCGRMCTDCSGGECE